MLLVESWCTTNPTFFFISFIFPFFPPSNLLIPLLFRFSVLICLLLLCYISLLNYMLLVIVHSVYFFIFSRVSSEIILSTVVHATIVSIRFLCIPNRFYSSNNVLPNSQLVLFFKTLLINEKLKVIYWNMINKK